MKYLGRLFASGQRQAEHRDGGRLPTAAARLSVRQAASLYEVTFAPGPAQGGHRSGEFEGSGGPPRVGGCGELGGALAQFALTASIGKTGASTSAIAPASGATSASSAGAVDDIVLIDADDWILVGHIEAAAAAAVAASERLSVSAEAPFQRASAPVGSQRRRAPKAAQPQQPQQMELDKDDVRLIRASWLPVRRDPSASGVLLFGG